MESAVDAGLGLNSMSIQEDVPNAAVCHYMGIAHHVQQVIKLQVVHAFHVQKGGMDQEVDHA